MISSTGSLLSVVMVEGLALGLMIVICFSVDDVDVLIQIVVDLLSKVEIHLLKISTNSSFDLTFMNCRNLQNVALFFLTDSGLSSLSLSEI